MKIIGVEIRVGVTSSHRGRFEFEVALFPMPIELPNVPMGIHLNGTVHTSVGDRQIANVDLQQCEFSNDPEVERLAIEEILRSLHGSSGKDLLALERRRQALTRHKF